MLELRSVHKRFPALDGAPVEAVGGISLSVQTGEFVSLLGPSGCGKTTLLRMVAGLETVEDDGILFEGVAIRGPHRDRGMVFQNFALFPWLTVRQNIAAGLRFAGADAAEQQRAIDHYLGVTGLQSFADAYPATLSGGMKQRVAIARTLANDPRIILMDEPFGALDAQTRSQMQEFLAKLWEAEHKTVVFVTHDIEEAIFLSSRVVLLSQRPATIRRIFDVPFPRPREHALKLTPEFYALKTEIMKLL